MWADLPAESATGEYCCTAVLLWLVADASGTDRDFHSILLVFSVFRRGLKVHAASAATSSSLLKVLALQVSLTLADGYQCPL